ncbi:hypothetical protein P9112_009610 [Eukaryota sp. TZLM1-RC]
MDFHIIEKLFLYFSTFEPMDSGDGPFSSGEGMGSCVPTASPTCNFVVFFKSKPYITMHYLPPDVPLSCISLQLNEVLYCIRAGDDLLIREMEPIPTEFKPTNTRPTYFSHSQVKEILASNPTDSLFFIYLDEQMSSKGYADVHCL